MSPNTNSNTFSLNTIEGISINGSGSNYLSNEIFYRVALMRERWQARNPTKPKFPTGHFHVAMVQLKIDRLKTKENIALQRDEVVEYDKIDLSETYRFYNINLNSINTGVNFEVLSNLNGVSRSIYNELSKLIKTVESQIAKGLNNFNDLF
jgi:hypothetical protein